MANIASNPWSFTTADQAATAAITSITRNGLASATVQLGGVLTGLAKNLYISIQGTGTSWNGGYRIEELGTAANSFLIRIELWKSALANLGAVGNVFTMAYPQDIDVTQMLWDQPTVNQVLSLTDQAGNLVWNPVALTGGPVTYMKAFPIFGLVINALPSGTLQISQ